MTSVVSAGIFGRQNGLSTVNMNIMKKFLDNPHYLGLKISKHLPFIHTCLYAHPSNKTFESFFAGDSFAVGFHHLTEILEEVLEELIGLSDGSKGQLR